MEILNKSSEAKLLGNKVVESAIRSIAFYLPQYHPIPENDEWWGKGFTEWTNVTKAKPRFRGHYQPHLPADLGFYDLRLAEVREAQADLARHYGIHGFCYYHYWFNGKRLLERPFNEVLALGKPDFPFCLCWANENWTRVWDGSERNILMEQNYGDEDDRQHLRSLEAAFRDERYIRVDGKPLFLVYRASSMSNPLQTTTIWREEAMRLGIGELFLCRVNSWGNEHSDPTAIGFDAAVEFQPDWTNLGVLMQRTVPWRIARKLGLSPKAYGQNFIYDYPSMVERMLSNPTPNYRQFPCVTPSFDNSSRRKSWAHILLNTNPSVYEDWLRRVIEKQKQVSPKENIVFINAWNEWAEGNHLEPCQKWGRAYLEATQNALNYPQIRSPEIQKAI